MGSLAVHGSHVSSAWLTVTFLSSPGLPVQQAAVAADLGYLPTLCTPSPPRGPLLSLLWDLATSPFSKTAKFVYSLLWALCSFCSYCSWTVVAHQDPFCSFSCLDGPSVWIGPGDVLYPFGSLEKDPVLANYAAASSPWPMRSSSAAPPFAFPRQVFLSCCAKLPVYSPVGLGLRVNFSCAVEEWAVYCWLPLDTDSRVPILTAAVRLPRVWKVHLWKHSVGLDFFRKYSLLSSRGCSSRSVPGEAYSWQVGEQGLYQSWKGNKWKECCLHRCIAFY